MSISSDTLRRLAALNLAPEAMGEVLSIIADIQANEEAREAAERTRRHANAERQARYKARHRSRQNDSEVTSAETLPVTGEPPLKERSPTPPKENNPPVPSEPNFPSKRKPARGEEPEGFAEWYAVYPRKVERRDAAKAYGRAAKEVPRERLLDAAGRYAARMAGKEPEFIKHPATWLNKGCWEDEEANRNGGRTDIEAQLAILHAPSA